MVRARSCGRGGCHGLHARGGGASWAARMEKNFAIIKSSAKSSERYGNERPAWIIRHWGRSVIPVAVTSTPKFASRAIRFKASQAEIPLSSSAIILLASGGPAVLMTPTSPSLASSSPAASYGSPSRLPIEKEIPRFVCSTVESGSSSMIRTRRNSTASSTLVSSKAITGMIIDFNLPRMKFSAEDAVAGRGRFEALAGSRKPASAWEGALRTSRPPFGPAGPPELSVFTHPRFVKNHPASRTQPAYGKIDFTNRASAISASPRSPVGSSPLHEERGRFRGTP